jgi:hypothetical protein
MIKIALKKRFSTNKLERQVEEFFANQKALNKFKSSFLRKIRKMKGN